MNGSDSSGQILIALSCDLEACILDHAPELLLTREPLDTLNEVLVAIAITGDELADEGDGAERPLLVDCVEERVLVDLAELETSEDTARLEDAVGLTEGSGDVCEVPDAEGNGVEIE